MFIKSCFILWFIYVMEISEYVEENIVNGYYSGDLLFFYVSTPESSRVNPSNSYSEFIDDRAFEYINNIYSGVDFSSNF